MNLNDYQALAMRTAAQYDTEQENLTVAALGMAGEAGEVAEIVKKAFYHGHDLDRAALIKETGDLLWYIARMAEALGVPLEEIAARNIDKLRARYPEGFSTERSKHRSE